MLIVQDIDCEIVYMGRVRRLKKTDCDHDSKIWGVPKKCCTNNRI